MKVIITGGGTAGHINPAIAIAQKIKAQTPETEILYVGTEKGMESDLAPRSGLQFQAISVKGFRRKLSLDTFKTVGTLIKGLKQANSLLNREKPDLVIGTGGYVCGPLVFLAALKKIRTLIHEQNAVPGATNKILSRFVDSVCISYGDSRQVFSGSKRVVLTGNPVRSEFIGLDAKACRLALGIPAEAFLVVSTGGSGGAGSINRAVKTVLQKKISPDVFWVHITGKNYYTEFMEDFVAPEDAALYRVLPFSHEMALLIGAADLMVSRSGALIIAEMATAGIPSILVPSPNVANRHQDYNAKICESAGMSRIIWENQLNGETLWDTVSSLKAAPETLKAMRASAQSMGMEDAGERILEEVNRLTGNPTSVRQGVDT